VRFTDEVALVAGTSGSIGLIAARRLGREGAAVALAGEERLTGRSVTESIVTSGGIARFYPTNLGLGYEVERMCSAVARDLGPPTIFVNNVSPFEPQSDVADEAITRLSDADWEQLVDRGLNDSFRLLRSVVSGMVGSGGGSIVNVVSTAARTGVPAMDATTAVDGAVAALSRSIASNYQSKGIRSNVVMCGPHVSGRLNTSDELSQATPSAGDVTSAVLYLASGEATFINGAELIVDGGSWAGRPAPSSEWPGSRF
jgi:NAD(P)-dependent dehydrogenase (short-subunit alcohol dehydrogenase family)